MTDKTGCTHRFVLLDESTGDLGCRNGCGWRWKRGARYAGSKIACATCGYGRDSDYHMPPGGHTFRPRPEWEDRLPETCEGSGYMLGPLVDHFDRIVKPHSSCPFCGVFVRVSQGESAWADIPRGALLNHERPATSTGDEIDGPNSKPA